MQIEFNILDEPFEFMQIVHCKIKVLNNILLLIVTSLVKFLLNVEHFFLKPDRTIASKHNFLSKLFDKFRSSSSFDFLLKSADFYLFLTDIILEEHNHLSRLVDLLNH